METQVMEPQTLKMIAMGIAIGLGVFGPGIGLGLAVKAMIEAPKNIDISRVKAYMPAFKGVSGSMEHINKGLATGIEILNTDITDIAKGLSTKWTDMVSKLHTRRISADMPVADLEALWRNEIELGGAV